MLTTEPPLATSFGFAAARDPHRSGEVDRDHLGEHPSPMPLVPPVTTTPRPAKRPGAKLSTTPVIDPVFKARRIFHRGQPSRVPHPEMLAERRASKDAALPVQRLTAGACFEARPSTSHLSMRKVGRGHPSGLRPPPWRAPPSRRRCRGRAGRAPAQSRPRSQRLGDVALEPEAVRLEIGAVRAGGEELHGHVMRAVRGDRQVEGLGQMGDLHERRDAAAIGDVGLGIGHAAAGDVDA